MADLKNWLETIAKPFKGIVIRTLLQTLRARQQGLHGCIRFLEAQVQEIQEDDTQVTPDSIPHSLQETMQSFIQDIIATDNERQPLPAGEGGVVDYDPRRRCTASSSTSLPYTSLTMAAGNKVAETVDTLSLVINRMVMEGHVNDYHSTMRIIAREIARQVHVRASRLRILLLLLADVPQPKQDGEVT